MGLFRGLAQVFSCCGTGREIANDMLEQALTEDWMTWGAVALNGWQQTLHFIPNTEETHTHRLARLWYAVQRFSRTGVSNYLLAIISPIYTLIRHFLILLWMKHNDILSLRIVSTR
jgi:hypothetical protein